MAFSTQFFADGSTVYGASDFLAHFAKLFSDGVVSGLAVSAPSSGMTVNVAAGAVLSGGILSSSDTAESVTIPTNSGTSARTDAIVYQIDTSANAASIIDVQGASTAAANQILLAVVTVPASATSIVAADIHSSGRVYASTTSPFASLAAVSNASGIGADENKGYFQFKNGLTVEFGFLAIKSYPANATVTFPTPFDSDFFPCVVATMEAVPPATASINVLTNSSFNVIQTGSVSNRCHWIAIGRKAVSHA